MSPEEIAAEFNYELEAVKMILLSGSSKFSDKALTEANERDAAEAKGNAYAGDTFTPADYNAACRTMTGLLDSEIDAVRYRAAEFVIDECKGRRDLKALKDAGGFNITIVNETMARARAAIARSKQKAVDISASRPRQVLELAHSA